jgi:hypothetical protein
VQIPTHPKMVPGKMLPEGWRQQIVAPCGNGAKMTGAIPSCSPVCRPHRRREKDCPVGEAGISELVDPLNAVYLRARLEGRQPDVAAIRAVLATMPPPPNPKLVAAGAYDLKDREIAAEVDAIAFASVRREGGLLIAEAERNDLQPAS